MSGAVEQEQGDLLAMTTLAPSVSSSSEMALPMPVPPPVTIATLPENRPGLKTDMICK